MRKRISPSPLRLKVSNIAAADTSQVNCEKKREREIKRAAFDNEWRKHLIMSAGFGFAGGSAQPN